jgi:hypothetical protein
LQSNYIPWKGYFDIISRVDRFIFHDDLQYTKSDWRNRNRIKTPRGLAWLTIPCGTSERRLICEVTLDAPSWQRKHWQKLQQSYGRTPFFARYREYFEEIYLGTTWTNLSELNQHLIRGISRDLLGLTAVNFDDSRRYDLRSTKADRVRELLNKVGATRYLSGPAARKYLDPLTLAADGIGVEWMDYDGYPEYAQPHPPFAHGVTILDALFCIGDEIRDHLGRQLVT